MFNNPLVYTDPSGMIAKFLKKWWRPLVAIAASFLTYGAATGWLAGTALAGNAVAIGAIAGGIAGAVGGAIATGTFKGAIQGAFSGAVFGGVAGYYGNTVTVGSVTASGVAGGVLSDLQGGKFGHGFLSAGVGAAVAPSMGRLNTGARITAGALVGGTVTKLTGGKFANGAISGAMQAAMAGVSRRGVAADGAADGVANSKIGKAATADANAALGDALETTYSSLDDAALAWSDAVLPVARKHGVEIGSMFFEMRPGEYRIGSAISSGARNFVEVRLGGDVSWGTLVGYAHTHPSNRTFSGGDMDTALQFYRSSGVHSTAYVALPNNQVWAWSTADWAARAHALPSSWNSLRTLQRQVR